MKITFFHSKSAKPTLSSATASWRERLSEDAYTDWGVILAASALTFLVLAAVTGSLYLSVKGGRITAPEAAASVSRSAFDPAALDSLVAGFDARASTTAELLKGFGGPADPSQ